MRIQRGNIIIRPKLVTDLLPGWFVERCQPAAMWQLGVYVCGHAVCQEVTAGLLQKQPCCDQWEV